MIICRLHPVLALHSALVCAASHLDFEIQSTRLMPTPVKADDNGACTESAQRMPLVTISGLV